MTLVRGRASWGTPLGPGHLAGIGLAQVVWRWPRYLFNPATRGVSGLRGYSDLDLFGDNRIVLNNEYRLFPLVDVALWQAGITLFHDMAGVWNQATELSTVRFHHGAGAGIQIGHTEGIGTGFFRFDVAWNFDRGEIGTLSFGVEETFDLFGRLEYSPPGPYLPE